MDSTWDRIRIDEGEMEVGRIDPYDSAVKDPALDFRFNAHCRNQPIRGIMGGRTGGTRLGIGGRKAS